MISAPWGETSAAGRIEEIECKICVSVCVRDWLDLGAHLYTSLIFHRQKSDNLSECHYGAMDVCRIEGSNLRDLKVSNRYTKQERAEGTSCRIDFSVSWSMPRARRLRRDEAPSTRMDKSQCLNVIW